MQDKLDYKNESPLNQMFGGLKVYIWLFAGLFIFYLILSPLVALYGNSGTVAMATKPYNADVNVQLIMAALLLILFAIGLTILFRHRITTEKLFVFVLLAGFIMRFGYMLYTPFFIRGHDVGTLNGYGHIAYIYRLFNMEGLPATNVGQFYHPPLEHIAGAVISKIYSLLTGENNLDTIFQSARLVPCFASCALLIVSSRLFDAFEFSKRAKSIALIVIAFQPTFIILSASINNDMLMIFFFMTAFLYTIRWYKDPTYKNILLLALSIGCAMSTKFSGALVAFYTAFVFLIVLIRKFRDHKLDNIFYQFTAFAAICFPLGLWYHIRNLKLFGQALGYVAQISPDSALYVGDKTLVERFLTFSLPDMLKNVYCNPYDDFRIWEYTVKCGLFGEFSFSAKHNVFADVMIVTSLILIILSLAAMIWYLFFDKTKNRVVVMSLVAVWALLMLSFVYFNIKYPFGCTMDFRYIAPTVIIGAAFLGLLSDKFTDNKTGKVIFASFAVLIGVFCVSTACFYII